MSFTSRAILALVLLGAALLCQTALLWHLSAAGPTPDIALPRKLGEIMPMQIGDWQGEELEVSELASYGDDHLKRVYVDAKTGQQVVLWMVYSKDGLDRGHHPEICTQVSGMAEDPSGQDSVLHLEKQHPAAIHQFLYRRGNDSQWIYYWHYTLKPPPDDGVTQLQRKYQLNHNRYSSMTLEVFAPNAAPISRELAIDFVKLVDSTLQADLPPHAVRGSDRKPVRRIIAN